MADLDRENKKAPRINPEKSGIRSGNPQLDPERAKRERGRPGEEPHRPEPAPDDTPAPNR
ncbi:MAG: hypothetical protein IRZ04_02630 [Rhodospirillales bacterium]|mgnify:CR=1 FL=1|nr:hypothetical protein [Rhodospirillales bacterium]